MSFLVFLALFVGLCGWLDARLSAKSVAKAPAEQVSGTRAMSGTRGER
jgi:hypothetical protein